MGTAPSFVKKITVSTVGFRSDRLDKMVKDGDQTILRVYGFIKGAEMGSSTYGEYAKYKGEFRAENLIDGDTYSSGSLILPSIADSAMAPMVDLLAQDKSAKVKFAVDIGITANLSGKGGHQYIFTLRSLMEPTDDDELSKFAKSLPTPKLLSAPKGGKGKK